MDLYLALEFYAKPFKSEYSCGETYESLDWFNINEQPKPSLSDLEEAWEKYLVQKENNKYKEDRVKLYPSIPDQLDLIYQLGIEGWRDEIMKIKNQFPKTPGQLEKKPEDKKGALIMELESKIKLLSEEFKKTQGASIDIKTTLQELNQALIAINGFLLMLPDMQKTLTEIQSKLPSE